MFQCHVFDINGLVAVGNGHSAVFDPAGRVLYRADVLEQFIPIEIDLEQVRRQRQNGIRGLGQMLKSFRDRPVDFPVYDRARFDAGFLNSLGPIAQPRRDQAPSNVAPIPTRPRMIG
jgi:hypothetical protein